MKRERSFEYELYSLLIRYFTLVIIILAFTLSSEIYSVLFNLTVYSSNVILSLFYDSRVIDNFILIGKISIEFIPACIGVSAYILLAILNLLTPMSIAKRIYLYLFSAFLFMFINVIRIVFLIILLKENFVYFDIAHRIVWYALSTIFVVGIWFFSAWMFKVRAIPLYEDIRNIIKYSRVYKK